MIIADSKDFTTFTESLKEKTTAELGFFIGNSYLEKTFIYMQSLIPPIEIPSQKSLIPLLSISLPIPETIYTDWIIEHSKQLSRLLPGGLDIIGMYIISEDDFSLENYSAIPESFLSLLIDINTEVLDRDNLIIHHYNNQNQRQITKIIELKSKSITSPELKLSSLPKLEEVRSFVKVALEAADENNPQSIIQDILKQ